MRSRHSGSEMSERPSNDVVERVHSFDVDVPLVSSNGIATGRDDGIERGEILQPPHVQRRGFSSWLRGAMNLREEVSSEYRVVPLGCPPGSWTAAGYPRNSVNNRRYSLLTFLPLSLLNQFQNFFNVFYLFLACSQFVPALKVGFLFTYFSPLAMVVTLSLMKDALNEFQRFRRDRVANQEVFEKLTTGGAIVPVKSCNIQVGDLLVLHNNQRIPADCILLSTSERSGTTFVRTDQLDGETDWKLRFPVSTTQSLSKEELSRVRVNIRCEPLHKDIYQFVGVLDTTSGRNESIGLENTLWASCVVASGTLVAAVIHTGADTRCAMNSTKPRTKRGLIESELNAIGVMCFALLACFSLLLVVQQRFRGDWAVLLVRFFILMSAMIPISMRVNVDVGRLWYSYDIGRDSKIPGTVARNTDLPEELGRLQYIFSDKTGTLTKNKMHFRVLQLGPEMVLTDREVDRISAAIGEFFHITDTAHNNNNKRSASPVVSLPRGSIVAQKQWLREVQAVGGMITCMVLCHNVTPVTENGHVVEFQASSPDEVALVKFCHSLNVTLTSREVNSMTFSIPSGDTITYEVIKMFPFSSERKCMGIIVSEMTTKKGGAPTSREFKYYMKGADVKMISVVKRTDWLEECCQELALVGLRTLVFASRSLTQEQLNSFLKHYNDANAIMGEGRNDALDTAMRQLEVDLNLIGVTGVEDELHDDVVTSLETLSMCGIRVWMLTGDKVETAATIGRSTRLIPRNGVEEYLLCRTLEETETRLGQLRRQYDPELVGEYLSSPWTLILDGTCLSFCLLDSVSALFVQVARSAHSVVVARCSPTQKAVIVQTMRQHSASTVRMAAIGDGGNDVAMILAANVGIGIEGVEGKQASMAADFSITKFSHCLRLIMWHGRNTYRRTCRLSQFIMHRGIVYAVVQAAFSVLFAGTSMSVFNGYLLMGYSTIFTMAPAFALVLDEDFKESDISEYPQLYKELVKSRSMNTRTFLQWIWLSLFQGGVMMCVALQLFGNEMFQIVTIAYTSLLITELVIVGSAAHLSTLWKQRRSHFWLYMAAEAISLISFFLAVIVLPDTFDRVFFFSWSCWWRIGLVCLASIGPLCILLLFGRYVLFNRRLAANFFR